MLHGNRPFFLPAIVCLIGIACVGPLWADERPPKPKPEVRPQRPDPEPLFPDNIDVKVPPVSNDPSVKLNYDIVYIRALRDGDEKHRRYFTEIATPVYMLPGADLMLLHPDGSEEVLVKAGPTESITDPAVSFDGKW